MNLRAIAMYLPQYHPIPENDEWWGKGFTEWTNVTKTKPFFRKHAQPRLPADLGFVDLRLPEYREAQAELAAAYGLSGFCYYHYWFEGKRLLERPFEQVLESKKPAFPFCLCWANETWSRRWLGEERNILIKQTYSLQDHAKHAEYLCKAFSDDRYIRVNEKPVFLIYRPLDIPELHNALDIYRNTCQKILGENIYLVGVDSHKYGLDFRSKGFDTTMNFWPQLSVIEGHLNDNFSKKRFLKNLGKGILSGRLKVERYENIYENLWKSKPKLDHHFPSVFVGWDNTPRRNDRGIVFTDDSPEIFSTNLKRAIDSINDQRGDEKIVFINAWNEWAEGNYLEPDQRSGTSYLEALEKAIKHYAL